MVMLSIDISLEFIDEMHTYYVLFSGASYIVSKKEKKTSENNKTERSRLV